MNNRFSHIILVLGLLLIMVTACSDDDNPVNSPDPIPVQSVFLEFYHYMDLDSGIIDSSAGIGGTPVASTDLWIAYNSNTTIHGRLFHQFNREIVKLQGMKFSEVEVADADSSTFQSSYIDDPFDSSSTFLIKTELGAVFKLGNPVEITSGVTFDYSLLSEAP